MPNPETRYSFKLALAASFCFYACSSVSNFIKTTSCEIAEEPFRSAVCFFQGLYDFTHSNSETTILFGLSTFVLAFTFLRFLEDDLSKLEKKSVITMEMLCIFTMGIISLVVIHNLTNWVRNIGHDQTALNLMTLLMPMATLFQYQLDRYCYQKFRTIEDVFMREKRAYKELYIHSKYMMMFSFAIVIAIYFGALIENDPSYVEQIGHVVFFLNVLIFAYWLMRVLKIFKNNT